MLLKKIITGLKRSTLGKTYIVGKLLFERKTKDKHAMDRVRVKFISWHQILESKMEKIPTLETSSTVISSSDWRIKYSHRQTNKIQS